MMRRLTSHALLFLAGLLISVPSVRAQPAKTKSEVADGIAENRGGPNFAATAARIKLGIDTAFAYRQLDTLLARPYGDMFWMYGCAGLYYTTRDVLRPEYKTRIRWCWKNFTPYRGDTENHFLMYYGSLLLMSQEWPDLPCGEWFMGKSSKQIYAESKEYLLNWIHETARNGQTEWNSPRYDYYYITPLVLLASYTFDSSLRRVFTSMLDLTVVDYALNYFDGNYTGAHSRVGDQSALDPSESEVRSYGDYFFEQHSPHLLDSSHVLEDVAFAALSDYELPNVIGEIARDQSTFENFEFKRGRTTIRNTTVANAPVYKYSYSTPEYVLGSMQGGVVQPIQQQSWSLVFRSNQSAGTFSHQNLLTGLHPYAAPEDLAMFFPEYPSFMYERIGNVKAGYTSENKYVGGSPYERIYQSKNVLAALYNIPIPNSDDERPPLAQHFDLYLSPLLQVVDTSPSNLPHWRIFRADSTLLGLFLFSTNTTLTDSGTRLRCYDGNSGYVLYCSTLRNESPAAFAHRLHRTTPVRTPTRIYSSNDGGHTINLPLTSRKSQFGSLLYRSPFINASRNTGIITLSHGADRLVLRFP